MNDFSCGFSTVVTQQWIPLIDILINSIISFSKFPITVHCINFEHNFNNERVKSKTLNFKTLDWNVVCMAKWLALKELPYHNTLMIDSDMIALPDVDNIFTENKHKIEQSKFPLFAKHPHDPFSNKDYTQHLSYLINFFTNNKPQMKYVYAHGLFHRKHQYFVDDLISNMNKYLRTKATFCGDEGLLNVMLTKHQVTEDIGYNYLPNTTLGEAYINNEINDNQELYDTYLKFQCPVKFYLLHGCKNPVIAQDLLQKLKNKQIKS